jgi:type I restriction enzyme M protein
LSKTAVECGACDDPPSATGGFLAEAFAHLKAQAKKATDIATLQQGSIFGTEAKPMPYMLCQMNLLLHGLDAPAIEKANSLNRRIADIGTASGWT